METVRYFLARPGFVSRRIMGETTLVPVETGNIYLEPDQKLPDFNGMVTLNSAGEFLWDLLQEPKTTEELTNALVERFPQADREQISVDVQQFLTDGICNQLILILGDG